MGHPDLWGHARIDFVRGFGTPQVLRFAQDDNCYGVGICLLMKPKAGLKSALGFVVDCSLVEPQVLRLCATRSAQDGNSKMMVVGSGSLAAESRSERLTSDGGLT